MDDESRRPWSARVLGWHVSIPSRFGEATRLVFGRAPPADISRADARQRARPRGAVHDEQPPPNAGAQRNSSAEPPYDGPPRAAERARLARAAFIDGIAMLEHTLHSAWRAVTVATRVCSQLGRDAIRAEWEARASRS